MSRKATRKKNPGTNGLEKNENFNSNFFNPLAPSVLNIGRSTKILISI